MEINYNYSSIQNDGDIFNLIKRIRRSIEFPYKKEYIKYDIDTLFSNLKEYKSKTTKDEFEIKNIDQFKSKLIDSKFKEEYMMFLNNDDRDYEKINILSDYFSEACRIHCKKYHSYMSPYRSFNNNKFLFSLIKELIDKRKDINWVNMRELLYKKGECTNFKLTLALSVYQFFNAKKVLDISAGWGDRLIAAIAHEDRLQYYNGFDPSQCMSTNYPKIIERLAKDKTKFSVTTTPFEKASLTRTYDLIFTSPPFFLLEVYSEEETQSVSKYKQKTEWFCNMLIRWLIIAWRKLEINGHMAINIEDIVNDVGKFKKTELFVEAMILFVTGYFKSSKYLGVIGHGNVGKSVVRPIWVWTKTDQKDDKYKKDKKRYRRKFKKNYVEEYNCIKSIYFEK